MNVIHGLDSEALPLPRSSLTVGNFDGVHRGHQEIIARTGALALQAEAPTVALTFEPHPLSVVAPSKAPPRLMSVEEKLRCLAAAGADIVVVAKADRALLSLSPERFIERITERLGPRYIVEGATFGFGRGRSGTPDTLRRLGPRYGFEVCVVEPVCVRLGNDEPAEISSSMIRRLIADGQVDQASVGLGRLHALLGRVVPGANRAASLGFPTANLAVTGQLVPAEGVYAGLAWAAERVPQQDQPWAAAISIGTNPTFRGSSGVSGRKIEAHLLDAQVSLYGCEIRLEFIALIRRQRRFDSPEALSAQITHDVEAVRRYAAQAAGDRQTSSESR